ncbi:hypothetical protein L249_7783 [Ophiocordyceps polyrhachis-furcata BCC 54312]|uniref:Uncharacterized protein n=1 Tax=Ophiocordyceps polyrhachis-furcata BCC 54312 TaxID=1330021 RepID=A0A367LAL2_9HYPO|nr:hypothetical protein L249_7783 [Ophiocordyceps polyrhachis-furcata BCC 54312]
MVSALVTGLMATWPEGLEAATPYSGYGRTGRTGRTKEGT